MTRPGGWFYALLLLNLILVASPLPQTEATFKVGAWGDDASRDNLGVRAQIETHTYDSFPGTLSYFWVGDDLADGSFIQFGYSLEPGTYCLKGSSIGGKFTCLGSTELIQSDDARWQWQYWPNRFKSDYYYGIGPSGSAGQNATFHEYAITMNSLNTWSFMFDGETVAQTSFPASPSTDPALIVAEGSAANSSQPLGPARFDGLSYYDGSRWKLVDSLIAASSCGISVGCVANEYGAAAIGPDSLIVGFGIPRSPDGTLLWTSQNESLRVQVHQGVQFLVTSVYGTQQYNSSANLTLPKGMFAYVSLLDIDTSAPGVLGWLGAQDHFQGWVGAVKSDNLTARILVDSNESVTAVWSTDTTVPTLIFLVAVVLVVAALAFPLMNRLGKRRLS